MADNEQENGMMDKTGNHALRSHTVILAPSGIVDGESEEVSEDILQQAFVGADDFDHESVEYAVQSDDGTAVSVPQEIVNTISDTSLHSAAQILTSDSSFATTYTVVDALPEGDIADDLIAQAESDSNEQGAHTNMTEPDEQQTTLPIDEQHSEQLQETEPVSENVAVESKQTQSIRFTLLPGNQSSGAPLGSSQNPIRIIQQGNQYTPVQQLTTEQLQQIMQVVQQQQLARNTQESGGSILFNPATNTRIVYRVIYPSELHKGQQSIIRITPHSTSTSTSISSQDASLPQKRQYRKKGREDEEDKVDGPEMSKEEKEERKKHRPRTRSGRVSKPPKHMVKDYKHIHVLDWDEDYDDSDGGYSDFKNSDEEAEHRQPREREKSSTPNLYTGLGGSTRPKNYKCHTCEKSYIGRAGLGRHYRLNPSHGTLPEETAEERANGEKMDGMSSLDSINNPSTPVNDTPNPGASSIGSSTGNLSEDSNTQDSIPSSTGTMSPVTTRMTRPFRGRGGHRGRWAHHHHTAPVRRKQKLKELVKTCDDEDLMEVVLPRLAKVITMWEFMLMKIESSNSAQPRVDQIYKEFHALHKHVKRVCQDYLYPLNSKQWSGQGPGQENGVSRDESIDGSLTTLKLDDAAIAHSLGLESGIYEVKDMPPNEYSSFRYKYLTSDPNGPSGTTAEKRTIQVVTRDELYSQSPRKRQRVTILHPSSNASFSTASGTATSLLTSANSVPAGFLNKPQQQPSQTTIKQAVSLPSQSLFKVQQQNAKVGVPVRGVSLVNTHTPVHSVPMAVQPASQQTSQQVIIVRNNFLPTCQIVTVPAASVVSSSSNEIPLSHAANDVTVISGNTESGSFLQQSPGSTASEIAAMTPIDFMDTSGDSSLSTLSGLPTSTEVVSMATNSELINGIAGETETWSEANMKTEKDSFPLSSADGGSDLANSSSLVDLGESVQSSVSSAFITTSTTSYLVKTENGELFTVTAPSQHSDTEPPSLTSVEASASVGTSDSINEITQMIEQESENVVFDDGGDSGTVIAADVDPEQLLVANGDQQVMNEDEDGGEGVVVEQHASIYQTEDGLLIIQNPDGTTFQLQGAQGIPLETVQALLAMEGHFEPGDQIQAELQ